MMGREDERQVNRGHPFLTRGHRCRLKSRTVDHNRGNVVVALHVPFNGHCVSIAGYQTDADVSRAGRVAWVRPNLTRHMSCNLK
jgi:hypothetical protein